MAPARSEGVPAVRAAAPAQEGAPAVRATGLCSVAVTAADPPALADFYERVWGLGRVAEHDGAVYLRGTGPEPYILAVHPGDQSSVRGYRLGLAGADAVDAAAEELRRRPDAVVVRDPAPLETPGGGYGFTVTDPDGREVELAAEIEAVGPGTRRAPVRPTKISHVVLNSPRFAEYARFLIDGLGFRLSDETPFMQFFKCNRDHHSVAVAQALHASLNHIAFEVPTAADVLSGVERMEARGYETVWGPGRHGPGDNVFGYFTAPNGQVVEYTAEVAQIDDADLAPRMWTPEDYERRDDWADPSSLRPTPEARALMLGTEEPAPHPAWG